MKGLETLLQIRENTDRKIEDLYRQLHEIGYFSDGKGGGVYPDCWDEVDDNWSALPDLNRSPAVRRFFSLTEGDIYTVFGRYSER